MPLINEDELKNRIKRSAETQAPDAWAGIERRINAMEQNKGNQKGNKGFIKWTVGATACAAIVLVAVALAAKPAFLFGGIATDTPAVTSTESATPAAPTATLAPTAAVTPDPQVRKPVPFTDNTALTKESGPSMDILFHETLKEFVQYNGTSDIAKFRFIRCIGSETAEDGIAQHTFYEMEAVKVFKGSLKPGDRITVRTFGGANANVWFEDDFIEKFTADFDYIFFLEKFNDEGKTVYQLASPLQGYVPLRGGAVSLNEKIVSNGLFTHGEKLEDLEQAIEEAVK